MLKFLVPIFIVLIVIALLIRYLYKYAQKLELEAQQRMNAFKEERITDMASLDSKPTDLS